MSNQASIRDIETPENNDSGANSEEFKNTALGKIPIDWQVKSLGEDFDIEYGDGKKENEFVENGDYPVYGANGVIGRSREYIYEKPVVTVTCRGATCGNVNLTQPKSWVTNNSLVLEDGGKTNPIFLANALRQHSVERAITGSAQPQITSTLLSRIDYPKVPLVEQRQIASVLYNVDQAIQKAEEIIEQTQRVKKGLMQDLFTEGYFEHEGYQDTPSGKYPSDWKSVRAGNYLNLSNGEFLKSNKRDEKGTYPVYGGNGIMGYTNDWNVEKQTIVIGRVGAYCGVVHKTSEKAWVTDNSIIVNQNNYDPYFLKTLLSWVNLNSYSEQSAQPRISQSTIENLRIPFPDREEQEKISKVLRNFDVRIEREKEEKKKIQRLKKGLMQDLLTGKVRTKNKDIEVLPEVLEVEE